MRLSAEGRYACVAEGSIYELRVKYRAFEAWRDAGTTLNSPKLYD
jgi:hypothetical protein